MSAQGKRVSVYVGDPIERVKLTLRDTQSPMTLSARLNQITHRYLEFVVGGKAPAFNAKERSEIRRCLDGMEITPSIIRSLDSLVGSDALAQRIEDLTDLERLMLIERLGL